MPQTLLTIEEYIVTVRKKDTLHISFNAPQSKWRMNIPLDDNDKSGSIFGDYTNTKKTNWEKREEFLQWMKDNYPNIQITDVFDYLSSEYLVYPFLGTIAIDVDLDSPEYHTICDLYDDANGNPKSLDAVLWIMRYDFAKEICDKKKDMQATEFE